MKVCGLWENEVDMEFSPNVVEIILKVIGSMINDKVKDHTFSVRRIKYL